MTENKFNNLKKETIPDPFTGGTQDMYTNETGTFMMLIPHQAMKMDEEPNANGVPIYAECPSNGPCACTGACRVILGYDTDPEKVAQYHKDVAARNEAMKEYRKSLFNRKWETGKGSEGIEIITYRNKKDNDGKE